MLSVGCRCSNRDFKWRRSEPLPSRTAWRPQQPCSSPARRGWSVCSRLQARSCAREGPRAAPLQSVHWLRDPDGVGAHTHTHTVIHQKSEQKGQSRNAKSLSSFIQDNGFSRWKSKITEGWSYGCDTMWLQSLTRLIKQALRWARVNGIFSRKEIVLILWFNSGPLPSEWSLIQQLIENTVCITKSLPDQSNKAIAFITCSKTNNPVSDLVEGSLRSPTRTCIDSSGQAHIWIQYVSELL